MASTGMVLLLSSSSQGFTLKGQFMAQSDNLLIFDYSYNSRRSGSYIPPMATLTIKSAKAIEEEVNAKKTNIDVPATPVNSNKPSPVPKVAPESFEEKRARILKRFMRIWNRPLISVCGTREPPIQSLSFFYIDLSLFLDTFVAVVIHYYRCLGNIFYLWDCAHYVYWFVQFSLESKTTLIPSNMSIIRTIFPRMFTPP